MVKLTARNTVFMLELDMHAASGSHKVICK